MKNTLPLEMLGLVLDKLSSINFNHKFSINESTITDEYEDPLPLHQLFILQELNFCADKEGRNQMKMIVMESICGKLGYCIVPLSDGKMNYTEASLLRNIPKISHDEFPNLIELEKIDAGFPQNESKFHNFKMMF